MIDKTFKIIHFINQQTNRKMLRNDSLITMVGSSYKKIKSIQNVFDMCNRHNKNNRYIKIKSYKLIKDINNKNTS